MINWNELREEYIRGGITQSALAERYGIPVGSLRRRAAAEGWCAMRRSRESGLQEDNSAVSARVARQLALTDRMVELLTRALEDDDELYRHVDFARSTSGSEYHCQRLQSINEDRAARMVKLMGELFEQQRIILGIHEYKDELSAAKLEQDERLTMSKLAQDERLTASKLEYQNALAERKLELEMFKLEGSCGGTDIPDDGFLAALGLMGDEPVHDRP